MPWIGGAIAGGGALLGGLFGSSSASKASKAQAASADRAAQLQKEMFDRQIELQEPYRQAGLTAQQRYMQLMGLPSGPAPTIRSEGELRNALAAQYMRPGTEGRYETSYAGMGGDAGGQTVFIPGTPGVADEAGLSAAIQAAMAQDKAAQEAYQAQQQSPDFGKYARDFGMQDFQQDPGYAFRMSEGLKALDRQAAARGGLISGAALKGAQRYGQEAASQEFTNAFNRYQTNRANQLQPLESLMGTSQTAANTLGQSAGQYAQNVGNAYMGAGAARASGYMGGANALTGALNQGLNMYQDQQFLNNMQFRRPGGSNYGVGSSVSYLPDNIDVGGGFNPVLG
jgi:hypothetical protein